MSLNISRIILGSVMKRLGQDENVMPAIFNKSNRTVFISMWRLTLNMYQTQNTLNTNFHTFCRLMTGYLRFMTKYLFFMYCFDAFSLFLS